jgi:drug/metabolite transporter (DMT)-like permease
MPAQKNLLPAYLALGIGVVCVSFSAIFTKTAGIPGIVSAFYRVLFAGIVIVPWGVLRHSPRPSLRVIGLIAVGGVFFALNIGIWNTGVLLTSAATATLLGNSAPLWVGLGTLFLLREHLPSPYWLGLVVAISGMAILLGVTSWHRFHLNHGDLLVLIAGGFYAGYLLTTQLARVHVDTLAFMTISVVSTIVALLAVNLAMGTTLWGYSAKTWWSLIGLGLISHAGGWLALNYALGHLRAAFVSVGLLSQVVVTSLLAIPLLGESLSLRQIIGGAVVLSGIFLANQTITQRSETAPSNPVASTVAGR